MRQWYGIWCKDGEHSKWLRELPSKVDDGGVAILAFSSRKAAEERAAKHYGYDRYSEVRKDGWCEVRPIPPLPVKS